MAKERCRLQLRTNIFISVALAIVAPLSLLILAATNYSERLYREDIDQEIYSAIGNMIAEVDRRLVYERDTFRSLATAPALEQYVPVLRAAATGTVHPEFYERTGEVNDFLTAFQNIVPSLHTIRILDTHANTLVKVRVGRSTPTVFDGIESFPYAEEELEDENYLQRLFELPMNEVGVTLLEQTQVEQFDETSLPMLDYIMPLSRKGEFVGYLVANILGEQIDRILDFADRPVNGKLLIAEINPEQTRRNGVILYDDKKGLRFSAIKSTGRRLQNSSLAKLYEAVQTEQEGRLVSADGKEIIYYREYQPYPTLLVHWVVALRINAAELASPFSRLRESIILVSVAVLLLGLVLIHILSSRVARPITRLVKSMHEYASGDRDQRITIEGADEIHTLGKSFNEMADTLNLAAEERDRAQHIMLQHAKLASIGQLAAGIGHELNNPLNNILTLSKLLERDTPEGNQRMRNDVQSLREETLRASEIVKGILNFARQVPPDYVRFDVAEWIKDTLTLVRQEANRTGVILETDIKDTLEIQGDRTQLQQVLINLLMNAIQASVSGDTVKIGLETGDKHIQLYVKDNGIGIEEDDMDRIFDPFYSSKPVGEGSGLGLSISLGIVEQHGGEIRIENNEGGGVTAYLLLPLDGKRDGSER